MKLVKDFLEGIGIMLIGGLALTTGICFAILLIRFVFIPFFEWAFKV